MKKLIMVLATFAAAMPLMAATETVGSYTWTYRINGGTAEISGVSPSTGAVTIPSILGGKPVTSIGFMAFYSCTNLTSVMIPSSVADIAEYAFYDCPNLVSIDFSDGLQTIGCGAFAKCIALRSVTFPASLLQLGSEITVPNRHITQWVMGESAMSTNSERCVTNEFSGITVWSNLTTCCSSYSVGRCRGMGVFEGCFGMTNICLNYGLKMIGAGAFASCTNIEELIIPDTVERIGGYAQTVIQSMSNMNSKVYTYSKTTYNGHVDVSTLIDQETISSSTITDDIVQFDLKGFCAGNTSLKRVSLSRDLKYLGAQAFRDCTALAEIDLPDRLGTIMEGTFSGCHQLKRVGFPMGLELIGGIEWFPTERSCVKSYSNVTRNGGFIDTSSYLDQKTIENKYVRDGLIYSIMCTYNSGRLDTGSFVSNAVPLVTCDNRWDPQCLNDWILPEWLMHESGGDDGWLKTTDIYNALLALGGVSYQDSRQMSRIRALMHPVRADYSPKNDGEARKRWNGVFEGCCSLKDVTLPDAVRRVAPYSFYGCTNLDSIRVSDGIEVIGYDVFGGGTCPKSVVSPWLNYGDLYEVFPSCGHITNLVLTSGPKSIENIREMLDENQSVGRLPNDEIAALKQYLISDCWISRDEILYGFTRLKSLGLPAVLEKLDSWIGLHESSNVETLVLPETLREIGRLSFSNCSSLMNVNIPASVTSIGKNAFYCCNGLTNIIFQGDAPIIGASAFAGVGSGCVAFVSRSSTGWGVHIPGAWQGLAIRYIETESNVTFDLCGHGMRTGGGELAQTIDYQGAAVAPEIAANVGWEFLGWEADFSCVTSNMTVNALWRRVYTPGDALGGTVWSVGTNGVAEVKGYDDATAADGKSVRFSSANNASVWVETVATNACRVSFDWKCSCEPLVKGRPYDYMAFSADGMQMEFICGEMGWTNVTLDVTGEGEHHLRWMFQRDEDGSSGEDCAWLANVSISDVPPETLGEYLNWPEQTFTTSGDAAWARAKGMSEDGYALRSGAITHNQTSRLETIVSGAGSVSFACRVEGEIVKRTVYDGLAFCIDGIQQGDLMGNSAWKTNIFEVTGDGSHTLSWLYVKDEDGDGGGEDCAWVDAVTWTLSGAGDVIVDAGGGKSVTVPGAWLGTISGRISAVGGDASAALAATAANGWKVWECYVLGLNPEDGSATNDFRITSFPLKADGTPDLENIAFEPVQAKWNVPATYRVKGAASLGDTEWPEVTEGNKGLFRFFKVELVLP